MLAGPPSILVASPFICIDVSLAGVTTIKLLSTQEPVKGWGPPHISHYRQYPSVVLVSRT